MAVTKIIPIRSSIEKSIAYICNPAKTDGSFFIHSEHCSPQTAALEFQHYLSMARAGGNTIGRHLIQSFAPGEVSPETAHEIGKKLAGEILRGQYAYVMTTHVNRGHIHNHFVWCAANIETHKKYRSNKQSYYQIRDTSDRLCKENSLSVIVPHGIGKSYTEYNAEKQGTSWKAKLCAVINEIISESADFEDFLKRMEARGYEVKRGKYISFRAPGQERFTRAKILGGDYAEDALKLKISLKSAPKTAIKTTPGITKTEDKTSAGEPPRLGQLIDIQNSEKCQVSGAYERWAKLHNLKVCAGSLMVFQKYGSVENFEKHFEQCIGYKLTLGQSLHAAEARIKELAALKSNILTYLQTKDVYAQYQSTGKRRDGFQRKNEADIIRHEAAKTALTKASRPLPRVKEINSEILRLRDSMTETNAMYKRISAELKQLTVTRKNLQAITGRDVHRQNYHNSDLNM